MMKAKAKKKVRRGPGKPLGTRNDYVPKTRRSISGSVQKDYLASARFEIPEQKRFVEEAADSIGESMSEFGATASIERAEKILARKCPLPIPPEAQPIALPA